MPEYQHVLKRLQAWNRPPALREFRDGEGRHATWLELFFDLVFVISIATLGHHLGHHLDAAGAVQFLALFLPIWWTWMGFSYYADQFDTDDLWFRFSMFASMFGVLAMTASLEHAFDSGLPVFALVYALLRLVLIILYVRAWRHVVSARPLNVRYLVGFSIGAAIWFTSLFVPVPLRFWLWAIAFTIELATPVIAYLTVSTVPAQHSHMDERFGLFAIVVLGESLVAIAAGTDQRSWDTDASITAVAGFLIAICAWSLYFDRSSETVIHDALRSDRLGMSRSFVYGYGHVFVFIGLLVTAVGVHAALESLQHPTPNPLGALCAGLAVYLAGTSMVQASTLNALSGRAMLARALAGGLAVVSMFAVPAVGVPLSVAFVALVLILLTLVERYELLVESAD